MFTYNFIRSLTPFNFRHQTRKGIPDYRHRAMLSLPANSVDLAPVDHRDPHRDTVRDRHSPTKGWIIAIPKFNRICDERSNFTSGKRDIIMSWPLAGFQMAVWKRDVHSGMTLLMKVTAGVQEAAAVDVPMQICWSGYSKQMLLTHISCRLFVFS